MKTRPLNPFVRRSGRLMFSSIFFALTAWIQTASANPADGNVTVGSATISQNGDILSVITATDQTVIDWQSFSIGINEITQITQPGANSATLNRVVGTMPSEILGSLLSNGKVALINEHGIVVGQEGVIDTKGFIGSTLNISNESFLASGDLTFSGTSEAGIENKGAIIAREGDVYLFGRNVQNSGSIEAQNGNAGLAAGSEIVLRKASEENVYVEVKASNRGDKVVNAGSIKAIQKEMRDNGGNPYTYAINAGGEGATTATFIPGGGVYLGAGDEGSVTHSGNIQAVKGDKGGKVDISGREVTLKSGSTIDASGAKGGGTVKVGGGYQGKDTSITNAKTTRIEKGAVVKADATVDGDGGRIIFWADNTTTYQGHLSAKGAGSGAGGFAEISGKAALAFGGTVDLTSASGKKGELLLDPTNLTIRAADPDLDGDGTPNEVGDDDLTGDVAAGDPGVDSFITALQVQAILGASNLTLAATDNITVDAGASITWNTASTLTLTTTAAGGTISVNGAITNTAGNGGLALNAAGSVAINAAIGLTGDLSIGAGADLNINGTVAAGGVSALSFGQSGGAQFTMTASGSLSAGTTVTGGAGDDTATFGAAPATAITVDLAGGSNNVHLSGVADTVTATAANTIEYGTATISGVGTVFGGTGSDNLINAIVGSSFDAGNNSVGGMTFNEFQSVDTALLILSAGADVFTLTAVAGGEGTGTIASAPGFLFTGLTSVDALGGSDTLVNSVAGGAFAAAGNTIGGVAFSNFETVDTASLTLTGGDDIFTLTAVAGGEGTGSHTGGLLYTGLTSVDALGGSDTLVNSVAGEAFAAAGNTIGGVAFSNFETVDTASLTLTGGDDIFTLTAVAGGEGTGSHTGGLLYTGLTSVDALGGSDTLVNSVAGEAFAAAGNTIGGVAFSNFETVDTASLTLTGGDDIFTLTAVAGGEGTGSHTGGLLYTGLTSVDALGGSDTLVNSVAGEAFAAAGNTIGGVAFSNFETVDTALLTLTAGNDIFTLTAVAGGEGSGSHTGGLLYTGLTSVDALGGSDTLVNSVAGEAFAAAGNTIGGVAFSNFETVDTALLTLTAGNDIFTLTAVAGGEGSGSHTGGLLYTGLTSVDALGGSDTLVNSVAGQAFAAAGNTIAGVAFSNFETVDTALLTLTGGNDIFTLTAVAGGEGSGSHTGGLLYTGLTSVDALGGSDTLVNSVAGEAFAAAGNTIGGVAFSNFETVDTALLTLTGGNDIFTLTAVAGGEGSGSHTGGLLYTGLTSVDALGGSDTLVNSVAGEAFAAAGNTIGGVAFSNFETVDTASLTLTGGNDIFTLTAVAGGEGSGSHTGGLLYTGLTSVDALGGSDTLVNSVAGEAFAAAGNTIGGVVFSNFETVDTALLTLTGGNDIFTLTAVAGGEGSGSHTGGLLYTGLTSVDALGGSDTLVNSVAGEAFAAAGNTIGGVAFSNFETVDTASLTLTGGNDIFTLTAVAGGEGSGSHTGGLLYTGLTSVDALGGSDTLVNSVAGEAFAAAGNTIGGVVFSNFETVDTALLTLTGGNDIFTLTAVAGGEGSGSHTGGLVYTGLTSVDALGGSDTLVNSVAGEAFAAAGNTIGGVVFSNFETVDTALLTLTGGNDIFTLTAVAGGEGSGSHTGGLLYTGLTSVDALGGADTLVNSVAGQAFAAAGNTIGGVVFSNFETVDTALLTLTGGNDIFTLTAVAGGEGSGSHTGGLLYTGLTSVDALGGSDTLNNDVVAEAYAAATNTIGGIGFSNFETVDTALLTLTAGDDTFTVTGNGTGNHTGGLLYTGLANVDALAGNDLINLNGVAADHVIQVNGANSATTSGITFSSIENMDAQGGTDTVNLTAGNDTFQALSAGSGTTNGIRFIAIENVNGGLGTNTFAGTVGTEAWNITGSNAGNVLGLTFTGFSQIHSGGTLIDRLTFTGSGDITGFISANGLLAPALSDLQFVNNGVSTVVSGRVDAAGLRVTSAGSGNFEIKNAGNVLTTVSADLDGSLKLADSDGFTVGTVDGVTGITTTGDEIELGQVGAGTITLAADVTTQSLIAGNVSFGRPVVLAADVTVTGGGIIFTQTVNGGFRLTANSSGDTRFEGSVGGTTELRSLTTDAGGTTFLGSVAGIQVNTTEFQQYNDAVRLVSDVGISASQVTFATTVDGDAAARGLTVTAAGDTIFGGFVGGNTALASLTTDGGGFTRINGEGVTTVGDQSYGDAVTLGAVNSVLDGANVRFSSTLDGAAAGRTLVVNTSGGGSTTFTGNVGSTVALESIETNADGSTTFGGAGAFSITTTGDQTYNDNVILASNTTISTEDLRFGADVRSVGGPFSLEIGHTGVGSEVTFTGLVENLSDLVVGSIASFIRDTDGNLELRDIGRATLNSALDFARLTLSGNIGTAGDFTAVNPLNQIDVLSLGGGEIGDLRLLDAGISGRTGFGSIPGLPEPGLVLTGNGSTIASGTMVVLTEGGIHVIAGGGGGPSFTGAGNVILVAGTTPGAPGTNEFRSNADLGADINGGAKLFIVANSIGTETDGTNFIGSDFSAMAGGGSPFSTTEFNFSFGGQTGATLVNTLNAGSFGAPNALHLFGAGPVIDTGGSDVAALIRAFFNDFLSTTNLISGDAESIVEIGKLARFESGLFPPLYGPFSVTSYEHEWYEKEVGGQVPEDKLYYKRRYPLYLKQGGQPPEVKYDAIIED
ncbi:filamentous hemagglutinin N-terminal domain-containing protein [Luteolibacter sp. SL250]|uniref:filamentous hemagglutinin N-terminal domain-containing protein n=1 Tax=Luteolibacter sp. SL250 TaxID=2995170 RepID=UPI0022702A45|nr:filamentous hemagglutinin N-terminal domain-containing protein [Luteolibacter sp. SL250]WAC21837.1 filamentous hemagglutinin N-terminal domain-containing protein [Luteolibacter sp. SL250]